jgi:hypothetical protein
MSTPAGIAAVSAVLRARLEHRLAAARVSEVIGPVVVTAAAPADARSITAESNRLTVYLHHANPDHASRSLPEIGRSGEPPLRLQLVYLVAASGAESYAAELLLGHAMAEFHHHPQIDLAAVAAAYGGRQLAGSTLDPANDLVHESRLAEQTEPLLVTQLSLNVDELSRLWRALSAPYRPTVAYQVGPLLIDGD